MSDNAVTIMLRHIFNVWKSNPGHSMKTSFVFSVIFHVSCELIIGGIESILLFASMKTGYLSSFSNK